MVATFRDVLVESVESRSGRARVYYSWAYIELRAPRSALGHIEPSSASLTMRAPCRRRPRSRRYGARASNSALASLECIQSLIIRCCLMHSATCSHPWRREVNRKCVVSIDTSILSRDTVLCSYVLAFKNAKMHSVVNPGPIWIGFSYKLYRVLFMRLSFYASLFLCASKILDFRWF